MVDCEDTGILRNLFTPAARWGWTYREQPPVRKCRLVLPRIGLPARPSMPKPPEPVGCLLLSLLIPAQIMMVAHWRFGLLPGWTSAVSVALFILALVIAAGAILEWKDYAAKRAEVESAWAEHQVRHDRLNREAATLHERAMQEHCTYERNRVDRGPVWFPVYTQSEETRYVHAFGGTREGWVDLLLTVVPPLLAGGQSVLVVDLHPWQPSRRLVAIGNVWGATVREIEAPRELNTLLRPPVDVADVLADALQPEDRRASYASLLRVVLDVLDDDRHLGRIADALRYLYRGARGSCLSTEEYTRLATLVQTVRGDATSVSDLRFLYAETEALSRGTEAGRAEDLWKVLAPPSLNVLRVNDPLHRRGRITEQIVMHTVYNLLRGEVHLADTLVIVGADRWSDRLLDDLEKQAGRLGMRLLYMCEHLRGEFGALLGNAGSATLLMRLENESEARQAAEFIGRGHRFVSSQISRSHGTAQTSGRTVSTSDTIGSSTTLTSTSTSGGSASQLGDARQAHTVTYAEAESEARGVSQAQTEGTSITDSSSRSTGYAEVQARVYEFFVEPSALQSLPSRAMLLVENGGTGRCVTVATCDASIAASQRMAVREDSSSSSPDCSCPACRKGLPEVLCDDEACNRSAQVEWLRGP